MCFALKLSWPLFSTAPCSNPPGLDLYFWPDVVHSQRSCCSTRCFWKDNSAILRTLAACSAHKPVYKSPYNPGSCCYQQLSMCLQLLGAYFNCVFCVDSCKAQKNQCCQTSELVQQLPVTLISRNYNWISPNLQLFTPQICAQTDYT